MMSPPLHGSSSPRAMRGRAGFTIIEILTIVAILGILAALLFPLVGRAQQNARNAKTRVQFSQWGAAIEAFRQEYGFYPSFHNASSPASISGNRIDIPADTDIFVKTLSGQSVDGSRLPDPEAAALNKKRISFYSFGVGDLSSTQQLQDAFGNTEIVVLLDNTYDGMIRIGASEDYTEAPTVNGLGPPLLPGSPPVRAGVIFYSAGAGNNSSDIVTSW